MAHTRRAHIDDDNVKNALYAAQNYGANLRFSWRKKQQLIDVLRTHYLIALLTHLFYMFFFHSFLRTHV